jgi:predicted TPR repeat methyltransferase
MDLECRTGLISGENAGKVKVIHAIDTSAKMTGIA